MRQYWQRKPLLIRAALPDFTPPIDRKRLFELARDPQAESRLITMSAAADRCSTVRFVRLPSIQRARWTLLVQGVDLLDDAARELLSRFRFIPDARLDDLMVSFATDGGGVGPHVDSYDVFLLQASGRRRWRISRQRGLRATARIHRSTTSKAFVHRVNGCSMPATCSICRRAWRTKESRSASA